MSKQITLLNGVDGLKDTYKILVRLTWLWRRRSSYSLSRSSDLEMILADEQQQSTSIKQILGVPCLFGFAFIDYKAIINFEVPDNLAIDVVGALHSCGKILDKTINDRKSKVLPFELQSLDGTILECAVWDMLAEQLYDHTIAHTNSGPIVVIIHLGRVTEFKEHAQVTNCFYGTRLFLDADVPEVSSFRNDFLSRRKDGPPHYIAAFVDKPKYSLLDDFVQKCQKKKLSELRDINTIGKYIAVANITALKLEPTWYYLSCNKCLGGVVEDDGEDFEHQPGSSTKAAGKWKCNKCKLRGVDAIRRFRIQIRVQDTTAAVSLTLFDRDVFEAVQKTAEEIYAQLPQGEEDDMIPTELNVLVDRLYAFKIDISDYTIRRRN